MKNRALSRKDHKLLRQVRDEIPERKALHKKGVIMLNKTIVATICVTLILIVLIIMNSDPMFLYICLGLIATLNGVSIWKANHKP